MANGGGAVKEITHHSENPLPSNALLTSLLHWVLFLESPLKWRRADPLYVQQPTRRFVSKAEG